MMKKNSVRISIIRFFEMLLGICLLTAGSALGIIAGLGQTTSTGTSSSIAAALGIKIGTAMFLLYGLFFILQLIMLGRQFRLTRLMQMIPVFLNMVLLNYFRYDFALFQRLNPQSYPQKLVILLIGILLISLGFTFVRYSEFANYPPESFCVLVSERRHVRFGTVKIGLDFVYILMTLTICLLSETKIDMIREGTLIFAVCNGTLINFYTPYVTKLFAKLNEIPNRKEEKHT